MKERNSITDDVVGFLDELQATASEHGFRLLSARFVVPGDIDGFFETAELELSVVERPNDKAQRQLPK